MKLTENGQRADVVVPVNTRRGVVFLIFLVRIEGKDDGTKARFVFRGCSSGDLA